MIERRKAEGKWMLEKHIQIADDTSCFYILPPSFPDQSSLFEDVFANLLQ